MGGWQLVMLIDRLTFLLTSKGVFWLRIGYDLKNTEELHNALRHTSHNKRKHNEIYDKNLFQSKKIRQNMAICLILFLKAAI